MEKLTWVVVANGSLAQIFLSIRGGELDLIEEMENPTAHLNTHELVSDRPGRSFDSNGAGRHAMEPPISPHEEQQIKFVRSVAERVNKAHEAKEFGRLYLVAAPTVLGQLRKQLSPNAISLIAEEFNKDLTHVSVEKLRDHLPFVL
jgi:protein required for attachment to host cells